MVEFLRQYRKNVLAVGILAIALIVLFLVQSFSKKESPQKIMKNNDYVFTLNESGGKAGNSKLPYINLKAEAVQKQNNEISKLYYQSIQSEKNTFTYDFAVNDGLLFLLIQIEFYDETVSGMETRYISYINKIDEEKVVNNEDVLANYGYPNDAIEKAIQTKMNTYYQRAITTGLVPPEECDFTCFMNWRDLNNQNAGALFIEDNQLVLYRGFSTESVYGDARLYKEKDTFRFSLEK